VIDIHCHLLPGIDDGPETLDEALAMARIAVANGITEAVLTPHVHAGRYENTVASVTAAAARFGQALAEHGIPLTLHAAGEIRIGPELLPMVAAGQVPWLGRLDGFRLILLELPHSHIPPGTDKLVGWCLQRGIRPVIPHPERNKDVLRDIEKITPLVRLGCLLQVTAGAVAGDFGSPARQRAVELLERGWVQFLASDAHNTDNRIPDLAPGRDAAAAIIGEQAAWALVSEQPRQMLEGAVSVSRAG
jgi:protein-tyrosine phosphatase